MLLIYCINKVVKSIKVLNKYLNYLKCRQNFVYKYDFHSIESKLNIQPYVIKSLRISPFMALVSKQVDLIKRNIIVK